MVEQTYTGAEVEAIGTRIWGHRGWQGPMADALGCSQAHISQVKTGKAILNKQLAMRLMAIATSTGMKPDDMKVSAGGSNFSLPSIEHEPEETDDEIRARLAKHQKNFELIIRAVCERKVPSAIIQGPAGIGKSFTVEHVIETLGVEAEIVKGVARPTGLFTVLYNNRDEGLVILDDCDSIFKDKDSFNILKSALDSTGPRRLSWLAESSWLEKEGVERTFNFNGSVIFLTNQDMEAHINRGTGLSADFEALMSRCLYISLGVKNRREIMLKMEQIAPTILGEKYRLKKKQIDEVLLFLKDNLHKWKQFSLRELGKICQVYSIGGDWQDMARDILMKK